MVFVLNSPAWCSCWRLFANIRPSVCPSCSRVVHQSDLRESLVAASICAPPPEAGPEVGFEGEQFTWQWKGTTGMGM